MTHPRKIVTKARKPTRHGLHLIATICTFGIWGFTGWPIIAAWNAWGPRSKTVTVQHPDERHMER